MGNAALNLADYGNFYRDDHISPFLSVVPDGWLC